MTVTDREALCNVDAEAAVLGAVLLGNGSVMASVIDTGVQPEAFYRETHAAIWQTMQDLHRGGRGIDFLVVTETLRQRGQLEYVGGRAAIDLLAATVPNVANAVDYARIVVKLSVWRKRLRAAYRQQQAAEELNEQAWNDAWTEVAP
jgi:replicative DNA helicase